MCVFPAYRTFFLDHVVPWDLNEFNFTPIYPNFSYIDEEFFWFIPLKSCQSFYPIKFEYEHTSVFFSFSSSLIRVGLGTLSPITWILHTLSSSQDKLCAVICIELGGLCLLPSRDRDQWRKACARTYTFLGQFNIFLNSLEYTKVIISTRKPK